MLDIELLKKEFFRIPSRWASQSNSIFADVGLELLKEKKLTDLGRQEMLEVNAIALGAIIAALAYNDSKYHGHQLGWISHDSHNKYYKTTHYPLVWEDLYKACDIENLLKNHDYDYEEERFKYFSKENPIYTNIIKITGNKILNGELPFNKEQLIYVFPKLEDFFNKIDKEIRKEYERIETEFNQITKNKKDLELSGDKKNLLISLEKLKVHTLRHYDANDKNFDFEHCMLLAKSTNTLINKVLNNQATTSDINDFKKATKSFSNAYSVTVNIILMYIVGIVAGILAGVAVGNLTNRAEGADIGAKVGFICASLGIWGIKKDPVKQLANDAEKLCMENLQPTTIKATH